MHKIMHQNYVKKAKNKTKSKVVKLKYLQKSVYLLCLITLILICLVQVGYIIILSNQRQITLGIVGCHFSSRLTAILNLCLFYFKITGALAILLEHMHKKFEKNRTKIKGGCPSRRHFFCFQRQIPLRIVGYYFSSLLTAPLNLCPIYLKVLVHVLYW